MTRATRWCRRCSTVVAFATLASAFLVPEALAGKPDRQTLPGASRVRAAQRLAPRRPGRRRRAPGGHGAGRDATQPPDLCPGPRHGSRPRPRAAGHRPPSRATGSWWATPPRPSRSIRWLERRPRSRARSSSRTVLERSPPRSRERSTWRAVPSGRPPRASRAPDCCAGPADASRLKASRTSPRCASPRRSPAGSASTSDSTGLRVQGRHGTAREGGHDDRAGNVPRGEVVLCGAARGELWSGR